MEKNIANELKKLDIEIAKKLFSISKENKIPEPPGPLQGRIMDYLIENQGKEVHQKELENAVNVSKATLSGALFTMEKNNIIKRITSPDDARSKKIVLTQESIRVHRNMKIVFEKLNRELIKDISQEELEIFYATLEKLQKNIQ